MVHALKTTSKRAVQKIEVATGDLIGNKIVNRITKVSKNSQQNNSEIVTNQNDKEIYIYIYMFRETTENY